MALWDFAENDIGNILIINLLYYEAEFLCSAFFMFKIQLVINSDRFKFQLFGNSEHFKFVDLKNDDMGNALWGVSDEMSYLLILFINNLRQNHTQNTIY